MENEIAEDTKYTVSSHGIHEVEFDVDNQAWSNY